MKGEIKTTMRIQLIGTKNGDRVLSLVVVA